MIDALTAFLAAAVRTSMPLALAAMGELLVERTGIINMGLEGAILAGAFGALVGASVGGVASGYALAIIAALVVAALFALFVVRLRADQIITGTALTLLSIGATGTAYRAAFGSGGAALSITTSGPVAVPLLSEIPVIGSALFVQPPITYFLYAVIPSVWWWLYRTHHGLALRALGETPTAVDAAGIGITRLRVGVILVSGGLAGLAGGSLVLAQAGTFAENMSAGRGFIAIAIVVLGRWRPFGVAAAAFLFGAASALQFGFQAMGWHLPYQLFLATPYVLTLVALAGVAGRVRPPASLGRAL
jgi:simple sugar transport system permease protein